jgi:5-methylcytosine-specific restriction endonuclease McrA
MKEWETVQNKKWPTYAENIQSKAKGRKNIADAGDKLQAHHIIPKQFGGPNKWWNLTPVPAPAHQAIIHAR